MSTKFFTNEAGNTLFEKFRGIAQGAKAFELFDAVTGFFRASGYFKLRRELKGVEKIRVLIGIDYDGLFAKHDKSKFFMVTQTEAAKLFQDDFVRDVREAKYTKEVEEGILQLIADVCEGRVELRMHASRNLHAKFYLCLPKAFNEHSGGTVIMGSSNLTDSGLGISRAARYELNVEIRDYDDVKFCKDEFERLWGKSEPLKPEDLQKAIGRTHLGISPTPYEIYMKVLIDSFGAIVEDTFDFALPNGVMDLRYQCDAAVQGFQMLRRHHGFYLADVVGLGKTLVAMMVIQRFVFENGSTSKALIVTPPSAAAQWEDMRERFKGMKRHLDIVTVGKIEDVLENKPGDYDLIVIDEAHNFRNASAQKFQNLQKLCKTRRTNLGRLNDSTHKFVMLLSATPLNNYPSDLRNQISLFQDTHCTTFDNIPDLAEFFAPLEQKFKMLRKIDAQQAVQHKAVQREVNAIYAKIRDHLLSQIMVRRTRTNIQNDPRYNDDIVRQGIIFPRLGEPVAHSYLPDDDFSQLFTKTVQDLSERVHYARYRAVEFLKDATKRQKQTATALASIFRVHMVKRLESSIPAFKTSIDALIKYTRQMIKMFEEDKVIIAPEYNVKELLERFEGDIDEALRHLEKHYPEFKTSDHTYKADDFHDEFRVRLKEDDALLHAIKHAWDTLCRHVEDPKWEVFKALLNGKKLLNPKTNPSGKLIVFTESAETAHYLYNQIDAIPRFHNRCLQVEAKSFAKLRPAIQENFDANLTLDKQRDDIKILISTDTLAEGINLHRANTIVHYDTPWNATRLMQRIGRVNRIGSTCGEVHNIVFYPSEQGDAQLRLCLNSFVKLTAFHEALGEDAKIFSTNEVIQELKLYNDNPTKDDTDKRLALLREVQALYERDPDLYRRIQALPDKTRTFRAADKARDDIRTLVFLRAPHRVDYYRVNASGHMAPITFVEAAKAFYAEPEETAVKPEEALLSQHLQDVEEAMVRHQEAVGQASAHKPALTLKQAIKHQPKALKTLRLFGQLFPSEGNENLHYQIKKLQDLVELGKVVQLETTLAKLCPKPGAELNATAEEARKIVTKLYDDYKDTLPQTTINSVENAEGAIIVSETFA